MTIAQASSGHADLAATAPAVNPSRQTPDAPDRLKPEYVVAIVYVASMFINIMDSTIVNVALPAISRDFGVAVQATDGVVVAYLVSLAIWIPAAGWVGDRFGTKRTFLVALAIFTCASAACGLAADLVQLIVYRVIQGIGGGMLIPVGMAMLFRAFPPHRRARASQILIIPTVIAPAVGPVIGGLLVDNVSWRWAFYINVPIGLLVCVFGAVYLREHRESSIGAFDRVGFVLAAVGSGLALLVLSEGPAAGWLQLPVVLGTLGSVAAFVSLVWVERRHPSPLVDVRLFANRLFAVANLVSFGGSAGFIGLLFLMPLFLQEVVHVPAATSGLTTFPEALGVLFATQVAGRIYPRLGPRRLLIGGLAWTAVITASMALLDQDANLWVVRGQMFLVGCGMAFVFLPLQTASFATISARETSKASAVFSAQRQLAAASGVAIVATVLAALGGSRLPLDSQALPFHAAFLVAAGLSGLGALLALGVRDADAVSTMRQRERQT